MSGRGLAFALAGIAWMISAVPAFAAPSSPNPSTLQINRQLASLVATPERAAPVAIAPGALSLQRPSPAGQTRLLSPQALATFHQLAVRYTHAERILDYRHAGFDANFWSLFDRSKTVKFGYAIRF